jgi:hypothetical protein
MATSAMFLVSRDDPLHERMSDDVAPRKLDDRDPLNPLQRPFRLEQPR